ncbi:MAG: pyruvate kinase alpha/beta domain-containing protein [Christensenellaceae bacterium]|jgi:hypothetical protein
MKTVYFEKPGKGNSKEVAALVKEAVAAEKISYVVVASNTGETAKLFADCGAKVICVTHVQGFHKSGENELSPVEKEALEKLGISVLTTTHVLSGAERGMSRKMGGVYPVEIMAHTLRMLGAGTKVGVEISVMALDSGLIPAGEKVIAVGGTGKGADTAVIITPAHAQDIFDTKLHTFLCKPQ